MIGLIALTDILTMLSPDTDDLDGTVVDTLPDKWRSPHYPKLLDEVRQDGITIPVLIRTCDGVPWLMDGHHRIAAAHELGLTAIPWTDDRTLMDRIENIPWNLTWGVIDAQAIEAFTLGACAGLALALHDTTDWPITEIGRCDDLPIHFAVRHPDGQLIDIHGARTDEDLTYEYEFYADNSVVTFTEVTRETVAALYRDESGEPVPMEIAATYVAPVLALINQTQTATT